MSKPAPAADASATAASGGKKLSTKLKIAGIVVAVVVVEWVVAYMYLPGATQTSQAASAHAEHEEDAPADEHEEAAADEHKAEPKSEHKPKADKGHDKGGHEKKPAHDKGGHGGGHDKGAAEKPAKSASFSDHEEVDLGEFTVTGYQPVSNATLFISFHLYGTIRHKDSDEFSSRLDDSKHRIRDNVIVIIRSAEITDLTDAGLGLIKRRILETTNKTLGKPLLQGVVFSDFSFIEQ